MENQQISGREGAEIDDYENRLSAQPGGQGGQGSGARSPALSTAQEGKA
jgi:hypothetical protein